MKILFFVFILFTFVTNGYAVFQDFGRSVRAAGMGNTYIAISDDISAPMYNPAGIVLVDGIEPTISYSRPYLGTPGLAMSNYLAAIGTSLFNRTLGVGYAYSGFELGNISYREINHTLTAGISLHRIGKIFYPKLNPVIPVWIGINYKLLGYYLIHPTLGILGNRFITFDIGILTELFYRRVRIGSVVRNLPEQKIEFNTVEKVPSEYAVGVLYKFGDWGVWENILLAMDLTYRSQPWGTLGSKLRYSCGTEWWTSFHRVGLRAGFNTQEITVGFSVAFKLAVPVRIDYTFIFPYIWYDIVSHHLVGLSFRL